MYRGVGLQGRYHKLVSVPAVSWYHTRYSTGTSPSHWLGIQGRTLPRRLEPTARFKNLLKPVSCLLPPARPTLLSLTHDSCLHHHTHTGARVTFAGQQHFLFEDSLFVC